MRAIGVGVFVATMHGCIYGVRYICFAPVLSGPSYRQSKVLSTQDKLNSRWRSFNIESNFLKRSLFIFSGTWFGIIAAAVWGRGEYLNE